VTKILKLPKLVNKNRVPKMKVGRSGIETRLDPERPTFLQFLDKLIFRNNFVYASLDYCQRFINGCHEQHVPALVLERLCQLQSSTKEIRELPAPLPRHAAQKLANTEFAGRRIITTLSKEIRRMDQQP
jgi:hypothetical protein